MLERGAVEGEIFHRGAVQALSPEESQVTPRLAALVRKGLIRPDKPQLPGEDAFRFRHLLIRDAAYEACRRRRAPAAPALRGLAGGARRELVELDELLGYHLEQAARYNTSSGSRIRARRTRRRAACRRRPACALARRLSRSRHAARAGARADPAAPARLHLEARPRMGVPVFAPSRWRLRKLRPSEPTKRATKPVKHSPASPLPTSAWVRGRPRHRRARNARRSALRPLNRQRPRRARLRLAGTRPRGPAADVFEDLVHAQDQVSKPSAAVRHPVPERHPGHEPGVVARRLLEQRQRIMRERI